MPNQEKAPGSGIIFPAPVFPCWEISRLEIHQGAGEAVSPVLLAVSNRIGEKDKGMMDPTPRCPAPASPASWASLLETFQACNALFFKEYRRETGLYMKISHTENQKL